MLQTLRLAVRRCSSMLRCSDDDGYGVAAAVIIYGAVITVTMLVVQVALVWHGKHVATNAAQDAVRSASGYQGTAATAEADTRAWLDQVAGGLLPAPRTVVVNRYAATMTVSATVSAHVLSVLPLGHFTVTGTATGTVQRFVPPTSR